MAKPQTSSPYKLSHSKFLFGYERCKKCYYLDIRHGLDAPGTFPSIFGKYDIIHKKSTEGLRTEDVSPDMPKGTFIKGPGDKFLESQDIDCGNNIAGYISGKGDAFLKLDDGSYAVIDFKTTAMSPEKTEDYSTQLHAYKYALEHNKDLTKSNVYYHKAQDPYKYKDKEIDLVISLNVLHSLRLFDLKKAIHEINRVAKQAYIVVESYRNEEELVNLQCWNTVGQCFFDVDGWIYLFDEFGYKGDLKSMRLKIKI